MKNYNKILLALAALFFVTSCALEEMPGLFGPEEGEEVVMTFKPKFEDFESVTKAIGDGSKVNKLLVQVYADGAESPEFSQEYNKGAWNNIKIPFFYGKTYKVYFWAYAKSQNAYEIAEGGLKNGVTVNYPENTDALGHDALEYLDAFYAVETINLSDDIADNTKPSLTRPFAQVNLVADKSELETAKATKVEFTIDAADSFVPGGEALSSQSRTFTFKDENFFKNNEEISEGKAYLGTTYLFVPSSGSLEAKVTLYDSMGNKLKGPSTVTIPLASNQRTNLVFTGVEPAWDDDAMVVPAASDGWIHIETPEQMAAFLLEGPSDGAKVHVCLDINMGGLPQKYHEAIAARTFTDLTLYGGALESGNPVGGGSHMISNFTAPAFLSNATNLTVSDLVLDNFNVGGNSHVGTLVNTLKGSSTFTNVTVSNSSATTSNGAAGGVVGYIERVAQTTRSEVLNVTFANCHVNGAAGVPVAAGSDAEGKFVGLLNGYDYGETLTFDAECAADVNTAVADYVSRYTEGNEGEWLETNDYTSYNGFLGEETYNRGTIIFGANQFVPMWDGIKQVSLLNADSAYDGWSSGKVIYSAFDLASLQGLKSTSGNYYLCADVDLGGDGKDGQVGKLDKDRNMLECGADDATFNPINYIANLNGVKKDKIGTAQASLTESDNYSIYNCKVVLNKHDGIGAGFIKQVTGTTNHNNINLIRAYVYNHHDETIPEPTEFQEDNGAGNAYAGTFVSSTGGTYTISNVHVSYGHVYALCKIGGIIGKVGGILNMSNCSVDYHKVENYEANIKNYYPIQMSLTEYGVDVYANQWWYTQGECGGLIGFIKCSKAIVDNCSVTNSEIDCYGQPNKSVEAGVYLSGFTPQNPTTRLARASTVVAGRHVNQFIGDVCSSNLSDTFEVTDYVLSGNTYFDAEIDMQSPYEQAETTSSSPTIDSQRHCFKSVFTERTTGSWWNQKTYYTHTNYYCNCVGQAYYVGVDVKININFIIKVDIDKHVQDYAGSLTFNAKGEAPTTITESAGDGNNRAWTGGDFGSIRLFSLRDASADAYE